MAHNTCWCIISVSKWWRKAALAPFEDVASARLKTEEVWFMHCHSMEQRAFRITVIIIEIILIYLSFLRFLRICLKE